jgi:UDP-N-acetylmuramate dehydrogenase
MDILHNISLKSYNTLGIDVNTEAFVEIHSIKELRMLLQAGSLMPAPRDVSNLLVLGGGSNILFTKKYEGLVIKLATKGIEILDEGEDIVVLKAGAGEKWDRFVEYCVGKGYGGIENLSGIPGNIGAAPIQNIGAYGVELEECFEFLEAFNIENGEVVRFNKPECRFGYRDSVFKNELKGNMIILSVAFRLKKDPEFNLSYKALSDYLADTSTQDLNLKRVREAVLAIRASKLPDPKTLGNAGSFFKNPQVDQVKLIELEENFPGIVAFPVERGEHKIAAGWLIDQCGWKGYREGDAGVHDKQALVLVNHGNASGKQIFELAMKIRDSVNDRFGITLDPEVQII